MFTLQIVDSDAFLDMPPTSQLLYFHLSMRADDDGFVGNPKKILRMTAANDDDLKILIAKRFILSFEDGIVVIKHWRMHNYIQNDRYKETQYREIKERLNIKENGAYTESIQDVSKLDTQVRLELGKDRLGKESSTITPSDISKSFFEGGKFYDDYLNEFSENNSRVLIEDEFKKFILYWTEPNGTGRKLRWQQQPTFEVRRRLVTWLGRATNYKASGKGKGIIGVTE